VRKADNLPPSCAVVTKSGNLNFLEPSGPLQACNGTALPFYEVIIVVKERTRDREKCGHSRVVYKVSIGLMFKFSLELLNTC